MTECLRAYQELHVLTMAELWAFPQMLRFAIIQGLVLTAGEVQLSHKFRQFSHFWANRLTRAARIDDTQLARMLKHMEGQPYAPDPDFITSLTEQLREEPAAAAEVQQRVEAWSHLSIADIVRREHQEETANRVSIANAVASLRQLDRMEYHAVFEATCEVDRILRADPAGIYERSDFVTRDRCRHGVEQISRTGPIDEFEVARRTVQLAGMGGSPIEQNVSYYLIGDGRERLESECRSRPLAGARFLRFLRRRATPVYLSSLVASHAELSEHHSHFGLGVRRTPTFDSGAPSRSWGCFRSANLPSRLLTRSSSASFRPMNFRDWRCVMVFQRRAQLS